MAIVDRLADIEKTPSHPSGLRREAAQGACAYSPPRKGERPRMVPTKSAPMIGLGGSASNPT